MGIGLQATIILLLAFSLFSINESFGAISTDKQHYEKGDIISISGQLENFPNTELTLYIFTGGYANGYVGFNDILSEQITTDENGSFSTLTIAGIGDNWIPSQHMVVNVITPTNERHTSNFSYGDFENFEEIILKEPVTVKLENKNFELRTQTYNLEILKAEIDPFLFKINFKINMLQPQGIFEVWFDTNLIDAKNGELDDEFIILANGEQKKYAEIFYREDNLRVVSVWLSGDVDTIEIIGTQVGSSSQNEEISEPEIMPESQSKLPDWVRNIFIWYAEGQIGEDDLISALEFLINEEIIKVKS